MVFCGVLTFSVSCSSRRQMVAPELPLSYADLGPTTGSACGFALLVFIPIGNRSTIDRAFMKAVNSMAGARSLRDVSISETWIWTPLGISQCATISGIGIGPR
jgi:hypothetical protein